MHATSKAENVFVSLRIVAVGFLFHPGPLCAWQLILRLREFEKASRAFAVREYFTGGTLLCST